MARSLKRRRHECKTDFRSRLELLKSGKPRLVIRKTNRYIIAQIVHSTSAQDSIMFGASSKDLLTKGWPQELAGSLKSIPAAYLTGFLIAKLAKAKVKEAILDLGMQRSQPKTRLFAALKGAIDGGLLIPHSEEALPAYSEISKNPKTGKLIEQIKGKL
ncbi:MAG: 50S ribosomal protein L18 [Nanoarchaeota archaeon]